MIRVELIKEDGYILGVEVNNHSNYAEHGKDIVCAAVSALSITLLLTLQKYHKEQSTYTSQDGYLKVKVFENKSIKESQPYFNYFVVGITAIVEQYPKYVEVV